MTHFDATCCVFQYFVIAKILHTFTLGLQLLICDDTTYMYMTASQYKGISCLKKIERVLFLAVHNSSIGDLVTD